jgi:long-chain acyl-CoA synthetase
MERIWHKLYEKGVPTSVDVAPFNSLVESFNDFCSRYTNNVAFSNFGVKLSYTELHQQVQQLAAYMQSELGIKKGDRIAIMMPNLLQYPISIYAALTIGAIVVNINPLYTSRELKHALDDSGASLIIICENFAKTLEKVIPDVSLKHVLVTGIGDRLGFKGKIMNFVIKHIKKMIPAYDISNAIRFNNALTHGLKYDLHKIPLSLDDLAFLQYTGGTTGPSKGAELTHANLIANANQFRAWIKSIVVPGEDVAVTPLPLYHIFSLTVCCLAYVGLGAECMLITNPRDINGFVKILKKQMGTFFVGINTLYNALAMHPEFKKVDFSKLKFCGSGGMASQQAVDKKWHAITGKHIIEGYGLTETSPVVTFSPMTVTDFSGSIGLPLPNTDVSVRDDDGVEVAIGQKGELWVKGPQVMRGYWNRPDETQKVFTDGWFKTGDIAIMDKQGWFYIVDRKKDMVIVSGFNVYPNEIESVLVEHEGVSEAAVIGVESTKTGEAVKAFVVASDPGLSSQDLLAYCRKNMTAYKVPKIIEFTDSLPKTNVGKVLRRALREA